MTGHEAPDASDDDRYLTALLTDYAALRQERQNDPQVFAALMGVAFLLVSALLGLLGQSCRQLPILATCRPLLWQPIYAFLPLAPVTVAAVFAEFSNVLVLRSYYMRAIEQQIQVLGRAPAHAFRDSSPMTYPSFGQLIDSAIYSPRTGFPRYSFLHVLLVVTLFLTLVPTVALSVVLAGPIDLQILMGTVYAVTIALLLRAAWATTIGGERFWRDASNRLGRARREATRATSRERSLLSYLVVPRPVDLLEKGPIVLLAWVLSAAAFRMLSLPMLGDVLVVAVVFELLLYQARYVLNDLRGLRVDGEYSAFKLRTRFPSSTGRVGVQAALVSAVVRLGLAAWFTARVVDPDVRAPVLVAAGALLAHTIVYEGLRAAASSTTGQLQLAFTFGRGAIFLLSGVGSAIRACLGIWLGQLHRPDPTLLAIAAVTMTLFASMYVTMQWTLDALGQVAADRDDTLPTNRYRRTLEQMSHLSALLGQARVLAAYGGSLVPVDRLTPGAEERMTRSRVLERVSSWTWWNAMLVMAMPFAAMVGLRAAGRGGTGLTIAAVLVSMAGAQATVLLYGGDGSVRVPGAILARPSPARAVLAVATTSAAVGLLARPGTALSVGLIASLPTLLVGGVYVFYRHASRADVLLDPVVAIRMAARVLARVRRRVSRVILGPDASMLLEGRLEAGREPASEEDVDLQALNPDSVPAAPPARGRGC